MARTVTCDDCGHENVIYETRCGNCNKPLPYDEDQNLRYVSDTESGDLTSNFSFAVEFECLNCGFGWEYKFKYGDRVLEKTDRYEEVRTTIDQSSEYPDIAPSKSRSRIICCEKCGSENDVSIASRTPAEEYEEFD